ncbi:MAG: alpha/beta hydrolase family protein [Gemmatimonadales bacterium]
MSKHSSGIRVSRLVALALITAATSAAHAQQAAPRLYRMMQGGLEVGRETYLFNDSVITRSVVVPIINYRADSRTVFNPPGVFRSFETTVFNAAGDTTRAQVEVTADGDSLRIHGGRMGAMETKVLPLRIDGVIPGQSVSVIAEAAERAGGKDTTFHYLAFGGDSTIAIGVHFGSDTVTVSMAGLAATLLRSAGPAAAIDIPIQRVHAEVWNGQDSLPPLRGLTRPAYDYTAPPDAPYTATDLRIPVRTAGGDTLSLAGTLTLPKTGRAPYPVVVTVSGSGRQTRDEDLWPLVKDYQPFRQIAARLATEGIGVFRFDDRGVGGSTGGQIESTTEDHADEVRQIIAALRARPDVNGRKIAILGHSEGGAIGPLVAAGDRALAAVVIMAGPAKSGRDIILDQFRWGIESNPALSDSARAAALAGLDDQADKWAGLNKWTRWFDTWDPLQTARKLHLPVLILQGALDKQVSPGQADTLATAIRAGGDRDVTEIVYPGLNHLFLPTAGEGWPSEYPALKTVALPQKLLNDIAGWLRKRLVTP